VNVLKERGDDLAGDAFHHPLLRLDNGDVASFGSHDGRNFEADIATADNGDTARCIYCRPQNANVLDPAHGEHPGQVDARNRQGTRASASRQHERAIVDFASVEQRDARPPKVERGNRRARLDQNVLVLPKVLWPQQ
jgi:hypothetical protein